MLGQTDRGVPLALQEARRWPLEPARIVEWVVPGLFGLDPDVKRAPLFLALGGATDRPHPFAESVHLGAAVVVLAWAGARKRPGIVLGLALLVLAWLAMGHRLGASQVLEGIPVWSRFRYPEKLMSPIALCASVLAGLGIDAVRREGLPRGLAAAAGAFATAAAGAALLGWFAPTATADALVRVGFGDVASFAVRTLRVGSSHAAVGFALAAAIPVALRRRPGWIPGALALLVVGQALAASGFAEALHAPRMLQFGSPIAIEAAPPGPRLFHPYFREVRRFKDLDAFDADVFVQRLMLAPPSNVAARIDDIDGYSGFEPLRWGVLRELGKRRAVAVRRYATTHVALLAPWNAYSSALAEAAVQDGVPVQTAEDPDFEVWEVPHRPWAFFATGVVPTSAREAALVATRDLIARGDEENVVVEAAERPPTAPGRIISAERGSEMVRIEAESSGAGLLVVNDAFWPGWRATIDGAPAEVLAADVLVRAVRWPAGRHTLVMTYAPPEIAAGLAVSAAGAVAAAALALWSARRRRPDGGSSPVRDR
jgi:hypothetical protein